MIERLARRFLRDSQNLSDPKIRTGWGVLCGAAGIALNLLLFAGKLAAGLISGSIAITADAFNNLSDAGSSVITLLGFRLAARKPDKAHPFGFGRMEYLSGLAVSAIILLVGADLLKRSFARILTPETTAFSWLTVAILAASIAVKLYMAHYNRAIGRRIDSAAMAAAAADSLSDAAATGVVLLGAFIARFTGWDADGWLGLMVSLFILWGGICSARDTIDPLLGKPPERALIEEIERTVAAHPAVLGMHDLIVHDYGPGRRYVSLHVEVAPDGDMVELHDEVDRLEQELAEQCACEPVIHIDPLARADTPAGTLRQELTRMVRDRWGEMVHIHDLRLSRVDGANRLELDALVPQVFPESDEQVIADIREMAGRLPGSYEVQIKIDKPYV